MLKHVGILPRLVYWIEPYLMDKTPFVKISKLSSAVLDVTLSVLQALILGPLPFLLYVNDIAHDVDSIHC